MRLADELGIASEQQEPHLIEPGGEACAVVVGQRRAREHRAGRRVLVEGAVEPVEPRRAFGVGEGDPLVHLCLGGVAVEVVGVEKRNVERVGDQTPDRGLPHAGDTHDDDDRLHAVDIRSVVSAGPCHHRTVDDAPEPEPMEANRRQWDERAPLHVASEFYDVDGFRAGRSTLRAVEVEEVGDVTGRELLHLQCHFGLDTLSWARRGARVTGLDFSESAVEAARALADAEGIDAEFVCANVYDAVAALSGRTYDVVYTGIGALCWLPDIDRWAATAGALVKPGGSLYVFEHHPFIGALGMGDRFTDLRFEYAYDSDVRAAHAMGRSRLVRGARRGDRPQRRLRVEPQPRRDRLGP